MGSLYVKGAKLWARYKDETGTWRGAPTPYRPGQEKDARRYLTRLEARTAATAEVATATDAAPGEPISVARYAAKWLKDRESLGLHSHDDDKARLDLHVLPRIGALLIAEVRPRHIRDLVLDLRKAGKLAPRTIHHVYHLTAAMFRTAVADEVIDVAPCVLARGVLPKKVDKDPAWRAYRHLHARGGRAADQSRSARLRKIQR